MRNRLALLRLLILPAISALPTFGQPVTGRPVSQFAWLDAEVLDLMNDYGIDGGMVAISRNGKVIYQRGFGWKDENLSIPMPENALCRVASLTKTITAAAVNELISDGLLNFTDQAFNVGQPGGGILNLTPFPSLGDSRIGSITIADLLAHRGGWDRNISGDLTYMECTIAADMGVPEPPGRENTMRWILGQPLDFTPNKRAAYSNVGYLALGLIVEQVSGQSLLSFVRSRVATAQNWVPSTDLIMGRTFEADQPFREVWYAGGPGDCVFDNAYCNGCGTNLSNGAYGAWDHEARTGQGRIVLSPAVMLRHMDRYLVQILSPSIGAPLTGPANGNHGGVLDGCNAYAWQRDDGVNVFMFFNNSSGPNDFGTILRNRIESQLDAQTDWPTMDVEGFWVQPVFVPLSPLYGSYGEPYRGLVEALTQCTDGSSLNLQPGDYEFTGRIETRLRVRAPLGAARIGN